MVWFFAAVALALAVHSAGFRKFLLITGGSIVGLFLLIFMLTHL